MNTFRIVFAPSFKEIKALEGKTVLEAGREAGVYIDSHCNGKGTCGKCRIRVVEGNVSPVVEQEYNFINENDRNQGFRLACMTRIHGDITVLLPGESILKAKAGEKLFSRRADTLNPAVKAFRVDLSPLKENVHRAFFEDVKNYLKENYNIYNPVCDLSVLQNISKALKDGHDKVTVFLWMNKEIISAQAGWDESAYGLALDIGTTTVALYLCDLKTGDVISSGSVTNPQVLFGTDVMSRISFSAGHPGTGVKKMQTELINSLNIMINQMLIENKISSERILDMTVVGNTVMHHIFLCIPPDDLGKWPFIPSIHGSIDGKAREFGLLINPAAYVHVLPVEAGFVGADNVGVLISEEPHKIEEMSLVIDLGTNGEIVLGNSKGPLVSSSCATGPALEGAHIGSGMRATAGSIEKVRIDPSTFDVDYAVIGNKGWASELSSAKNKKASLKIKPVGVCGSGIIDAVAHFYKTGLISEDGAFSKTITSPRLRKKENGEMEFVLVWKEDTGIDRDIVLTQNDVRQIQLAKGALHGGCRVLMKNLNVKAITRMVIAGAFGLHIDKENALTLGLIPWCEPDKIIMAGNSAGHGAYLALVNIEKREEADKIARDVKYINLALDKNFQKEFLNALTIPYKSKETNS
jgi:uncharacterized 2Fe-2S/4Fe-4S cluster protein (DUF4445 family)